jgi:hypothetical protein
MLELLLPLVLGLAPATMLKLPLPPEGELFPTASLIS